MFTLPRSRKRTHTVNFSIIQVHQKLRSSMVVLTLFPAHLRFLIALSIIYVPPCRDELLMTLFFTRIYFIRISRLKLAKF